MKALLLNPKAQYVLSRFAQAGSRAGVDLTVMLSRKPPDKHYLFSFENDVLEAVAELPAEADDAEAMAPQLGGFDAVVAGGEYSVIFGERLAARLGVFHNPLEPVDAYRDKHQMRRRFAEAGVRQPRLLARFASMDEVEAFDWASVQFPVIVKPLDLSSSFYVRRCEDAQGAKKVYRRIFKHSQSFAGVRFTAHGLLEELVLGPEYSAECVIERGRLRALFLTTKFLSAYPTCDEVGHLSGESFAGTPMEADVRRAVEGIVQAWQVESGVMHVEFKLSDGLVKVIEAACRIGGDMISTITDLQHGVSLEECLVRLRCRGDVDAALQRQRHEPDGWYHGIKYLFSENQALPLPADVEVLEHVRHGKEDGGHCGFVGLPDKSGDEYWAEANAVKFLAAAFYRTAEFHGTYQTFILESHFSSMIAQCHRCISYFTDKT